MLIILFILSFIPFIIASPVITSGTCTRYPANASCSNFIDYNVFLPNGTTLETIEASLQQYKQLGTEFGQVSPVCFDAFSRYICSKAYPKCQTSSNQTSVYTACLSSCEEADAACASLFKMAGYAQLLPNCTTETTSIGSPLQPDNSCNNIQSKMTPQQVDQGKLNISAAPSDFIIQQCPAPFVKDTLASTGEGKTLDPKFCQFGCCIPCPAQNLFYKDGWAKKGFTATNAVRFVSAVLSAILCISYLVLPDKRRHPSLLILNLALSIFFFSMTSFFSIGNPERLQCSANGVTPGEMGNNALCAAQGAILVFSSFATTLWCCALILNLHVHTVWKSNFFVDKYLLLNIICWGIPTVITCIALGLHSLKFEFASLCLVKMEYVFKLYFYPLAAIICPSFLIHIGTFFYIATVAIREGLESDMSQSLSTGNVSERPQGVSHRHLVVAVKIQWRALLLAVVAIVTILFYWLAYMTQVNRITTTQAEGTLTQSWLQCMLTPGNSQNTCYEILKSSLPSFPLMVTADALAGLIGCWLFILFGKRSLWREWNDLIYDLRIKLRGKRGEKYGEQFFAL